MGSALGALRVAARRVGLTEADYRARLDAGQKWCTRCKTWHARAAFGVDLDRADGLAAHCLASRRVMQRKSMRGGAPNRRAQWAAADAVRAAVRRGELAPVRSRSCERCGEQAKHYHHHRGYAPEHRLSVLALCVSCHRVAHFEEARP